MNVHSPQNPAPLAPDTKGTPNPRPMGLLTLPAEVKERELEYVGHRRQATGYVPPPDAAEAGPSDLIGLSLSGGGIRSATFSLGVLQKLATAGVLPVVDYLCTVSGGGYAGSCFSSLMTFSEDPADAAGSRRGQETQSYSPSGNDPMWWKRRAAAGESPGNAPIEGTNSDPTAPRMDMTDKNPLLWRETCQHLRKHGDFVIQRQGLFCRETLRAFGWFVIGLLCTFTSYVLLILLSGSLFSLLVSALAGTEFWSHDGTPRAVAHAAAEPGVPAAAAEESPATLSGALSGVAASFRGFVGKCGRPWDWHVVPVGLALVLASTLSMYDWRAIREAVTDPRNGSASESGADLTERGTLLRIVARHLAVLTAIVLLTGLFGLCVYRPGGFFSLWTPLSYGLGVTLMGFAMGTLYLPYSKRWTRSYRSPVGSLLGMGGIGVAAGLLMIVLAWGIRDLVSVQSAVWSLLSLAATLGVSRLLMSLVDGNVERMTTWKKYSPAVLNSILAVLVVLFVLLSFLLAGRLMVWLASWAAEHRAEIVSTAGRLSSWLPGSAWPRESGEAWAWFVACQTLAALLLAASFCVWGRWIDFNRIGPHYFYRDRLTEAYLQTEASITVRHPQTGNRCTRMELVRNDASLLVKNLLDWPGRGNPAPYHLIECAVNLAGSRDLA
ncbi:MAG: patatin-like phospholipase family protein, partial [Pirellulaceae bacterium]|nr:patatin-like phospholipase family protein [Pirellulaceae bacterium]